MDLRMYQLSLTLPLYLQRFSMILKNKETAGLVQQLPKIDQVEVMDISSQTVEELEMQETEVEDIDADYAGNLQLVVEYVKDIYGYLRYLLSLHFLLNSHRLFPLPATWSPCRA
jgi:hypothetical protein